MPRLIHAIALSFALATLPFCAAAQTVEQTILAQLEQQGFVDITVTHTLLGRVRILAIGPGYRREIVFNPTTGEILRDYLVIIDSDGRASAAAPTLVNPGSGSSGSGDTDDADDGGDTDDSGSDDTDDGPDTDGQDDDDTDSDPDEDGEDEDEDEEDEEEDDDGEED